MITKFCGCFDLRKGIIGYGIVSWILGTISFIVTMCLTLNADEGRQKNANDIHEIVIIVCIVAELLATIIYFLLILGAYKKYRGCLLAYLIITVIPLVLASIAILFGFVIAPRVLIYVPGIAWNWYVWLSILHFRASLSDGAGFKPDNMVLPVNEEVPYTDIDA